MNDNLFRISSAITSVVLATLLSACSGNILPDSKKIEYKSAGKLPSLEVPPDLTQPTRDDRYAVPDISPKGSATYSEYAGERRSGTATSTSSAVLPSVDKMRIERAGTQRWLVAAGTPDQIWPQLKEFWQEAGFIVDLELPEAGVMETDWAENRAKLPQDIIRSTLGKVFDSLYSTAERDKFRTRIEKGAEPGTIEIYISHRGMYEVYVNEGKSETRWQPRPAEPELEAEMLRRLMLRFGVEKSRADAVLAKQQTPEQARIVQEAGAPVLEMDEGFDRAWRRVGLALDRVGFAVEDRDRSKGVYFVRYIDPEIDNASKKDEGIFSNLAFWRSKKSQTSPQLQIVVIEAGEKSRVSVTGTDGKPADPDSQKRIINLLYKDLK
jgi:outer membrane protein assembly factor BamC